MPRERRRFPRAAQPFEAHYRLLGEIRASWHTATIMNLSAGGIRLRGGEPLPTGNLLELAISLPSRQQPILLHGRVTWDRLEAAGVIEYGIEFIEISQAQQLQIDEVVRFVQASNSGRRTPA